jgi:hypothetical protein
MRSSAELDPKGDSIVCETITIDNRREAPDGYVEFYAGCSGFTRAVKSRCDKVYVIKEQDMGATKAWRMVPRRYYAPRDVVEEVLDDGIDAPITELDGERIDRHNAAFDAEFFARFAALYPNAPEEVPSAVLRHSFAPGSGRVGTNWRMPLDERIDLAVEAHVRHQYTDYDSRWDDRDEDREDERYRVQREVNDILRQWAKPPDTV